VSKHCTELSKMAAGQVPGPVPLPSEAAMCETSRPAQIARRRICVANFVGRSARALHMQVRWVVERDCQSKARGAIPLRTNGRIVTTDSFAQSLPSEERATKFAANKAQQLNETRKSKYAQHYLNMVYVCKFATETLMVTKNPSYEKVWKHGVPRQLAKMCFRGHPPAEDRHDKGPCKMFKPTKYPIVQMYAEVKTLQSWEG